MSAWINTLVQLKWNTRSKTFGGIWGGGNMVKNCQALITKSAFVSYLTKVFLLSAGKKKSKKENWCKLYDLCILRVKWDQSSRKTKLVWHFWSSPCDLDIGSWYVTNPTPPRTLPSWIIKAILIQPQRAGYR